MHHRSFFKAFIQSFSKLGVWLSGLLLVLCLCCLGFADSASAADRVYLVYGTTHTTVDYKELEAFADDGEISENLQAFFQDTSISPEEEQVSLTDPIIPASSLRLSSGLTEFAAIQVSQILGDPLGREVFDSLESMLSNALSDDRSFNILELAQTYPGQTVRLNLDRLNQVQSNVSLFVERLAPLLAAVDEVMNDLFCACTNEPAGPARIADVPSPQPLSFNSVSNSVSIHSIANRSSIPCTVQWGQSPLLLATLPTSFPSVGWQPEIDRSPSNPETSRAAALSEPLYLAQADRDFSIGTAQELVVTFGPLARSIPMTELTALAETGTVSRRLRSLLGTARISPDHLRAILNKEAEVNLASLDSRLNGPLGEFALYEVGKVVRTRSGKANIQALRSALVLSARDDNKITLIEFLQNYPGQQVYLEGAKLARLASLASNQNRLQEFAIDRVQTVEDFLVNFQASIAADICNCGATE